MSPAKRRAISLAVVSVLVASGLVAVVLGDTAFLDHLGSSR